MTFVTRVVDTITLGSDHPLRRLIGYYALLLAIGVGIYFVAPGLTQVMFDDVMVSAPETPFVLQDGIGAATGSGGGAGAGTSAPVGELLILTTLTLLGTLLLMLPVTWVYMSAREVRGHNPAIVQTLIILPIVVAGVVFVVRNSLALAFSLAGVVAAVRFRTTLRDTRDIVFIFLAIAVGFASGVYMLGVGALVSMFFNFVVLLSWRYGFGRNVLTPTASSQWKEPLSSLAEINNERSDVPDREVMLALTPEKVALLAERFERVQSIIGKNGKRPRFNAVLFITTDHLSEAQPLIQHALDDVTKRWELDEIIAHTGKPSEIYYLVRLGKNTTRDEVITAVHSRAGDRINSVELQLAESEARKEQPA